MEDLNIDSIVSERRRKVKGYSHEDKLEDSNDLNPIKTEVRTRKQQPEPELRWAIKDMDRRIKHEDFRDRFPSETSEEIESRTEASFKKALRSFTRSYTRSIKLVK